MRRQSTRAADARTKRPAHRRRASALERGRRGEGQTPVRERECVKRRFSTIRCALYVYCGECLRERARGVSLGGTRGCRIYLGAEVLCYSVNCAARRDAFWGGAACLRAAPQRSRVLGVAERADAWRFSGVAEVCVSMVECNCAPAARRLLAGDTTFGMASGEGGCADVCRARTCADRSNTKQFAVTLCRVIVGSVVS
jgi:hypothetical protein